jgi:hypothetical protein
MAMRKHPDACNREVRDHLLPCVSIQDCSFSRGGEFATLPGDDTGDLDYLQVWRKTKAQEVDVVVGVKCQVEARSSGVGFLVPVRVTAWINVTGK